MQKATTQSYLIDLVARLPLHVRGPLLSELTRLAAGMALQVEQICNYL
jgi:hypothetical protein